MLKQYNATSSAIKSNLRLLFARKFATVKRELIILDLSEDPSHIQK